MLDADARDRGVRQERHPAGLGAPREADGHLRRVEIEVLADAHHREHAFGVKERIQAMRLVRRNPLDIQPKPPAACEFVLHDGHILRPAGDFEGARLRPRQRLSGVRGESLDILRRQLHQLHHQVAGARVAQHPRGARGGLRRDVVFVDDHDALDSPPGKIKRGRGAQPTGADHDDIGVVHHRTRTLGRGDEDLLAAFSEARATAGFRFWVRVYLTCGRVARRPGSHRRRRERRRARARHTREVFSSMIRESIEVLYQFEHPFVMDASKFVQRFGSRVTPHREAIRQTLVALRGARS